MLSWLAVDARTGTHQAVSIAIGIRMFLEATEDLLVITAPYVLGPRTAETASCPIGPRRLNLTATTTTCMRVDSYGSADFSP